MMKFLNNKLFSLKTISVLVIYPLVSIHKNASRIGVKMILTGLLMVQRYIQK